MASLIAKAVDEPIVFVPKVRKTSVAASVEQIDWGIKVVGIPEFWKTTKGDGVKVAVLDTGIAVNHPDLKDAIDDLQDFTNSVSGPADVHGHGTHIAGTIAARENSYGVIGAAPNCRLLIGKVLGDNSSGSDLSVANGIRWAMEKGADIISMSFGSPFRSPRIEEATKEAAEKGVLLVAAAGNEGPRLDTMGYPGKFPWVVSVGAIGRNMKPADFSSRSGNADEVLDIMAPGEGILSTYPPADLMILSGTSMACPLVSGITALMVAKHRQHGSNTPLTNWKELKEHLIRSAIDLGDSGWDPQSGYGLVNPRKLLEENGVLPKTGGEVAQAPREVELTLGTDISAAGLEKLQAFFKAGLTSGTTIKLTASHG